MSGRLVVVFGGSGFVGRHLVQRLALDGTLVRVVSRHPADGFDDRVQMMAGSVHDDRAVERAVHGAEAVINLVGIIAERSGQTFDAVHRRAAARIAAAARRAGARRLVHMSALGASPVSRSAYARSKAAGEQAVRRAFADATIVRPSIVVGPGDHFFSRFAAMAEVMPALPLIGGGRTRFQPVYVGDVAAAYATILGRPDSRGALYELGGPQVFTFAMLMRLMLRRLGRQRLLMPLPFAVAGAEAAVLEHLPGPLLTRDQVVQLRSDNVVSGVHYGLGDLGLCATPLAAVLPSYITPQGVPLRRIAA